jgi:hypothetical protein
VVWSLPVRVVARATVVVFCVAALLPTSAAEADPGKCRAAVIGEAARLVQAEARAFRACDERAIAGDLPLGVDCRDEPRTRAALARSVGKLRARIAKKCGGPDRNCSPPPGSDDDSLASFGWDIGVCPDLGRAGCTNEIVDCNDVATCLVCTADAAVDRAEGLYYGVRALSTASDARSSKCRRAIGRETAGLFAAKTTILQQCSTAVSNGRRGVVAPCPEGDSTGKTPALIARAESRASGRICKACGGRDRACGGADDVPLDAIGFPAACPAFTVPRGPACTGTITTLRDLVACASCVTTSRAVCLDAVTAPWATPYPAECNPDPVCGNGVREGGEDCDGSDAAACADGCRDDCRCTIRTVTTTTTRTSSSTGTTTTTQPVGPNCGNDVVDPGEECDGTGCGTGEECVDCHCVMSSVCGNGIIEPGEECDGAGCPTGSVCDDCACQMTMVCGDGIIDPGEQCDGTGCGEGEECLADCTCSMSGTCGNGVLDPGEQCDFPYIHCPGGQECREDCTCP